MNLNPRYAIYLPEYTTYSAEILDQTKKKWHERSTMESSWPTVEAAAERAQALSKELPKMLIRVIGHRTMEMEWSLNGVAHCQDPLTAYRNGREQKVD